MAGNDVYNAMGIYVHVPFCIKKCYYCDFVSYVYDREKVQRYLSALAREARFYAGMLTREEKRAVTLYIGGGTPTCLATEDLVEIISFIIKHFDLSAVREITVEANPGTVDREKLTALRRAGVNRISIGVQSCSGKHLCNLGRIHTFRQAVEAVETAAEAGFDNIGADLIFGLPGQLTGEWKSCLNTVAGLGLQHISAYGLQIEEGTPLAGKIAAGELSPCDEDDEAEMFTETMQILREKGYRHYEISNYALPGRECQHNLGYWRNGHYLGLGPAAHSYLWGARFANESSLGLYEESVNSGSFPILSASSNNQEIAMAETVFLGLRLIEGLNLEDFRLRFGKDVESIYGEQVNKLVGDGLLIRRQGILCLTERGIALGNRVFSEFV